MKRFVEDWKETEERDPKGKAVTETSSYIAPNIRVVYVIIGGHAARGGSASQRKKYVQSINLVADQKKRKKTEPIIFTDDDLE